MKKSMQSLSIFALLLLIVAFQNCQMNAPGSSFETRSSKSLTSTGGLNGNGGGYTGKINIAAPSQISDGQPYVVVIEGGAPPYKLSSPEGQIEIVNVSGNVYELRNRFSQAVTRFDLDVRDSLSNTATATIEIIASDNVFNYSRATSGFIANNKTYLFDHNLHMVLVFDTEGIPVTTLNPFGNRQLYFSSFVDLAHDSLGNIFVLEPEQGTLSYFDSNHQFIKQIDFNSLIPGVALESMTVHNDQIFIVDGGNNKVLPLNADGSPTDPLLLSGVTFQKITSVAFDDARRRIYVSDGKAKNIKVFTNGSLTDTITAINWSGLRNLMGPQRLQTDTLGNLYVIDRIWQEGQYVNKNGSYWGEEWTWKLNHSSGSTANGTHIFNRRISYWHSKTDCLTVKQDKITYCDNQRYFKIIDSDGQEIEYLHPHRNAIRTVNEPQDIIVDDEGNYFVTSNYSYLAAISKDQEFIYQKLGWGDTDDKIKNISGVGIAGNLIFVGGYHEKVIKVYNKYDLSFQFKFSPKDDFNRSVTPNHLSIYDNKIFIKADDYSYIIYDLKGNLIRAVDQVKEQGGSLKGLGQHRDFAVDSQGYILFHDISGKKTYIIDSRSDTIVNVLTKEEFSNHVFADRQRNLIFYEEWNSIVYYNLSTGEKVGSFGVGGIIPGTFNQISSIAVHDNYIYATDYHNQRVQKISVKLLENID